MLDTVRLWATERGARVLHLGGGVGSKADSLFQFKAGFSDRRHLFHIWRWIVQPDIYERLCRQRDAWGQARRVRTGLNHLLPGLSLTPGRTVDRPPPRA